MADSESDRRPRLTGECVHYDCDFVVRAARYSKINLDIVLLSSHNILDVCKMVTDGFIKFFDQ